MDKDNSPFLIPLNKEEFMDLIRKVFHDELANLSKKPEGGSVSYSVDGLTQKPLYKGLEVCKMLHISRQTLHTWVKEGILPQYKIKSRVFFLWRDIENLITPKAS